MASYVALYDAAGIPQLDKQIQIALVIKANVLSKTTTPTTTQKTFIVEALSNPTAYLTIIRNYIFAEYNTAAVSALTTATDLQVQTAVNMAVDTILGI
jgi:hypothetical protein